MSETRETASPQKQDLIRTRDFDVPKIIMRPLTTCTLIGALVGSMAGTVLSVCAAAPQPEPRAARSVHLFYQAPPGTLFYNEVTVDQSRPGSYFQVCGFSHGYFGIQELGNKKKVAIFSVWDPGDQNDPTIVPADRQVELVSKGPGVRAGRFGGEGTGGQSFFDYNWKNGETYRFLVRATVQGKKTEYTAFFYLNREHRWQEMAAFRTLTGGSPLTGYYSFIEDFRRDGKSAKETRRARYGNGWIQTADGDWISLCRARFTADNNPSLNIDAGLEGNQFFLANGGATLNRTPLRTILTRSPLPVPLPPPLP